MNIDICEYFRYPSHSGRTRNFFLWGGGHWEGTKSFWEGNKQTKNIAKNGRFLPFCLLNGGKQVVEQSLQRVRGNAPLYPTLIPPLVLTLIVLMNLSRPFTSPGTGCGPSIRPWHSASHDCNSSMSSLKPSSCSPPASNLIWNWKK